MKIPEGGVKRRIITPDDGAQYFFGYYDLLSYDTADKRHLMHRVNIDFMDGLPTENDVAELAMSTRRPVNVPILPKLQRGISSRARCFSGIPRTPTPR